MPPVPSSNLVAVNNLSGNFPVDPSRSGLVIGPSTLGTANAIILDDSINTLISEFGTGPASDEAGTALAEPSHGTVYQIKTATSTAGAAGSVTKTPGATVGTGVDDFGAVLVNGVDFNGDVIFSGKAEDAELEIVSGGAEATSVVGSHVKLTTTGATTGTSLAALITGVPAALALWGATAIGTGASLNASLLSTYSEAAGRIVVQALTGSMQVRTTIAGNNTLRAVALTGGTIVDITQSTNAHAEPTASAITIQSDLIALTAANPGKFKSTLAGSGAGLLGAKALAALPFGSTGAMVVTGSIPNDNYDVTVRIKTAGALGAAVFEISLGKANGVPLYSGGTYLIPIGGVVSIPGTGLTLTFTGVFDVDDLFSFLCTPPLSTLSDVSTAIAYFLSRPEQVSLIAIAGEIPLLSLPAWIAALDVLAGELEAAKKYARIGLEAAGPSVGQSNATWATNLNTTLNGLSSARLWIFGGEDNGVSALPLPQPSRFETENGNRWMFARALALSAGVDVGDQTLSGKMTGVLTALQADVAQALANARVSYNYLLPGISGVQAEFLLFDSPTGDFTYGTYGRIPDKAMFYGYIAQTRYLNGKFRRTQSGTIDPGDARGIAQTIRQAVIDNVVKPGDAVDCQVVVDLTNTDNRLIVTYYIQVPFYAKTIDGRAGIVKTLSSVQVI